MRKQLHEVLEKLNNLPVPNRIVINEVFIITIDFYGKRANKQETAVPFVRTIYAWFTKQEEKHQEHQEHFEMLAYIIEHYYDSKVHSYGKTLGLGSIFFNEHKKEFRVIEMYVFTFNFLFPIFFII